MRSAIARNCHLFSQDSYSKKLWDLIRLRLLNIKSGNMEAPRAPFQLTPRNILYKIIFVLYGNIQRSFFIVHIYHFFVRFVWLQYFSTNLSCTAANIKIQYMKFIENIKLHTMITFGYSLQIWLHQNKIYFQWEISITSLSKR